MFVIIEYQLISCDCKCCPVPGRYDVYVRKTDEAGHNLALSILAGVRNSFLWWKRLENGQLKAEAKIDLGLLPAAISLSYLR